MAGGEELVAQVQAAGGSGLPFDKVLATADIMPKLARVARILGPRGLMPNPKLGTIVAPSGIRDAVRAMRAGRVEYRRAPDWAPRNFLIPCCASASRIPIIPINHCDLMTTLVQSCCALARRSKGAQEAAVG